MTLPFTTDLSARPQKHALNRPTTARRNMLSPLRASLKNRMKKISFPLHIPGVGEALKVLSHTNNSGWVWNAHEAGVGAPIHPIDPIYRVTRPFLITVAWVLKAVCSNKASARGGAAAEIKRGQKVALRHELKLFALCRNL